MLVFLLSVFSFIQVVLLREDLYERIQEAPISDGVVAIHLICSGLQSLHIMFDSSTKYSVLIVLFAFSCQDRSKHQEGTK